MCLDWNGKRPYLDRSDFYGRSDSGKLRSFGAGLLWLTEDSLTLKAIAARYGEWKDRLDPKASLQLQGSFGTKGTGAFLGLGATKISPLLITLSLDQQAPANLKWRGSALLQAFCCCFFMPDTTEQEALQILHTLISRPFADCIPVGREFPGLTSQHSIYAIRHRSEGLLYIGKSQNPKSRFTGGHKALVWCWLEGYNPDDVRITACPLDYRQWATLSLDLETLIIQATKPPFNTKIPMRD